MYVCLCKGLTDRDVQQAGRQGTVTRAALIATFGLKDPGCCGRCAKNIRELVTLAADQLTQA
ncbi:MAG: (2Fe-2S)-binding protein [Nitrospiraceae bacterium]